MTRRDIFSQFMMEASGLPSDSACDHAGTPFHDFDHNAIVAPLRSSSRGTLRHVQPPGFRRQTMTARDME